jgi:hypothetical protein
MDRYKEPVEIDPDFERDARTGSVSAEVHKQLCIIVRALARSAAVAEHRSADKKRKDQT